MTTKQVAKADEAQARADETKMKTPINSVDPFEKHFTSQELAGVWSLDETTIRRMFQDEPGVLRIGKAKRKDGRRDYVTIRIPESVARRKHEESCRAR